MLDAAATCIQRHLKGWLLRKKLDDLKRKVRIGDAYVSCARVFTLILMVFCMGSYNIHFFIVYMPMFLHVKCMLSSSCVACK